MASIRVLATFLFLLSFVAPAPAGAQTSEPAAQPAADDWPWPAPDPRTWWDDEWPKPPEVADPLGGRRLGRNERPLPVDNGFPPLLYRLWALQPLQTQILRGNEMILEVAVRPTNSVRQSIIRVTVRRDGDVFVQGRAGLGCCEAGIARRVGFDAEAPEGSADRFLALRNLPLWESPRDVRVDEGGGAADAICVDGTSYELTLAVPGRTRSVRRACDKAAIGEAADALEAAFSVALGHEPRFDVIFPDEADFSAARRAYDSLIAGGGRLKPAPNARPQPPTFEPSPLEAAPTEPAPETGAPS